MVKKMIPEERRWVSIRWFPVYVADVWLLVQHLFPCWIIVLAISCIWLCDADALIHCYKVLVVRQRLDSSVQAIEEDCYDCKLFANLM